MRCFCVCVRTPPSSCHLFDDIVFCNIIANLTFPTKKSRLPPIPKATPLHWTVIFKCRAIYTMLGNLLCVGYLFMLGLQPSGLVLLAACRAWVGTYLGCIFRKIIVVGLRPKIGKFGSNDFRHLSPKIPGRDKKVVSRLFCLFFLKSGLHCVSVGVIGRLNTPAQMFLRY